MDSFQSRTPITDNLLLMASTDTITDNFTFFVLKKVYAHLKVLIF